ncbi:hypothetical protein [Halorhabdus sp. CBA1104]|uniref:hypothetical protein n=1 Tax=Halorhabdus sp. CBA1104 TaxID=1380432 RepID=UPI0012B26BEF|nr:hypothetical protein [Halorhabdus sp. CBA1104]
MGLYTARIAERVACGRESIGAGVNADQARREQFLAQYSRTGVYNRPPQIEFDVGT